MNNIRRIVFIPDKKDGLYGRMEVYFEDYSTSAFFSRSTLSGYLDLAHGLGLRHTLLEGTLCDYVEQISFPSSDALDEYVKRTKAKK